MCCFNYFKCLDLLIQLWKAIFFQWFHLVAHTQCSLNKWSYCPFRRARLTTLHLLGSGPSACFPHHLRQAAVTLLGFHFQACDMGLICRLSLPPDHNSYPRAGMSPTYLLLCPQHQTQKFTQVDVEWINDRKW